VGAPGEGHVDAASKARQTGRELPRFLFCMPSLFITLPYVFEINLT